jgi:hypothetical protein
VRALALLGGGSLALLLAAAVACDDARKPPFLPEASPTVTAEATPTAVPTPTSVATPTAVPEEGGMTGFRAFARKIEAAVKARDAEFFMGIARISTIVCPSEFEARCEGQPDGSEVHGINVGFWRSEGTIVEPDQFRQDVASYLDSLAQPTLHAIGRRANPLGAAQGPAFLAVVVSADDPQNTTRVFEFIFTDEGWRMSLDLRVSALAEEWLSGGCRECYAEWERWEGTN